jgi:DNA-binding GntR family transcriptional regulator
VISDYFNELPARDAATSKGAEHVAGEHAALLDAIARGDEEAAAKVARAHIRGSRDQVRRSLAGEHQRAVEEEVVPLERRAHR